MGERWRLMRWIWQVWRGSGAVGRHISTIFSLTLAEAVVWWRRRFDRWRHFRSAWRHQRPPTGIQAAAGDDARSSDWLQATYRRTRRCGPYSIILKAPAVVSCYSVIGRKGTSSPPHIHCLRLFPPQILYNARGMTTTTDRGQSWMYCSHL